MFEVFIKRQKFCWPYKIYVYTGKTKNDPSYQNKQVPHLWSEISFKFSHKISF